MHVADEFPGHAAETFDKATKWLQRFGQEQPFFLFVHTYEVHTPYVPEDDEARATLEKLDPGYSGPFLDMYPGGQTEVKHNRNKEPIAAADVERMAALYASEIEYLDRIFGRFMQQLSRLPFADEMLVVLMADHGDEFNEHGKVGHGETLYNPVLHVPLAFHWPGRLKAGVEETRVQLVDVAPTLLDLVGIAKPDDIDGQTLAPLMVGGDGTRTARPVFAELRSAWASCRELALPDDCRSEHYAVQTERFKYLTSMIPWSESLYDLSADPDETRDVAKDFPQELRRLRGLLAEYVIDAAPEPDYFLLPPGEAGTDGSKAPPALDETTRERLKALGYNP
jgi:arylsulfatase A-like enzyme